MQIIKKRERQVELDMMALAQLILRKLWLLLSVGLVTGLIALFATILFIDPLYTSSITLYANNKNSPNNNTSITTSDINASVQLVDTYAAIILSDPVMDQVVKENQLGITGKQLCNYIRVSSINNTEVFKVTVEYYSPQIAANIANSIADIAPIKIGEIVDGCSVKIVSNAKTPTTKSSPNNTKLFMVGLLIGISLSLVAVVIVARLDTRIKNEADLADWDYPVLGIIPAFSEAQRSDAYKYGYGKRGRK